MILRCVLYILLLIYAHVHVDSGEVQASVRACCHILTTHVYTCACRQRGGGGERARGPARGDLPDEVPRPPPTRRQYDRLLYARPTALPCHRLLPARRPRQLPAHDEGQQGGTGLWQRALMDMDSVLMLSSDVSIQTWTYRYLSCCNDYGGITTVLRTSLCGCVPNICLYVRLAVCLFACLQCV